MAEPDAVAAQPSGRRFECCLRYSVSATTVSATSGNAVCERTCEPERGSSRSTIRPTLTIKECQNDIVLTPKLAFEAAGSLVSSPALKGR